MKKCLPPALWKFRVQVTFSCGSKRKYCTSPNSKWVRIVSITCKSKYQQQAIQHIEYARGDSTRHVSLFTVFKHQEDSASVEHPCKSANYVYCIIGTIVLKQIKETTENMYRSIFHNFSCCMENRKILLAFITHASDLNRPHSSKLTITLFVSYTLENRQREKERTLHKQEYHYNRHINLNKLL